MSFQNTVSQWQEKFGSDPQSRESLDWIISHSSQLARDMKTYTPNKFYKYMLTFTMDPNKKSGYRVTSRNEQIMFLEGYIFNLIKNSSNVYRAYMAMEHKDTNCHWHVIIHTKKALNYSMLRYYKKTYGMVDVSRSVEISDENSIKYLGKENIVEHIKGEKLNIKKVEKKRGKEGLSDNSLDPDSPQQMASINSRNDINDIFTKGLYAFVD